MAKHHSRKQQRSRKQKKSRRQSKRRQSRRQHGGACAAQPVARSNFQQQGGFADWNDPTMILDRASQVQAQSFDQVAAIEAATAMAKAQVGGRRRSYRKHKGSRKHSGRKHKGSRKHGGRKHGRRGQKGGMAPFDAPYMYRTEAPGANVQFQTEGTVNQLYFENKGAQPFLA